MLLFHINGPDRKEVGFEFLWGCEFMIREEKGYEMPPVHNHWLKKNLKKKCHCPG